MSFANEDICASVSVWKSPFDAAAAIDAANADCNCADVCEFAFVVSFEMMPNFLNTKYPPIINAPGMIKSLYSNFPNDFGGGQQAAQPKPHNTAKPVPGIFVNPANAA